MLLETSELYHNKFPAGTLRTFLLLVLRKPANQLLLYSDSALWWSWRFYRPQLITPLQLSLTLRNTWWQVYNEFCWRPVWLRDVGVTIALWIAVHTAGGCYGNTHC